MVYLRELIEANREKLLQVENIELAAYLSLANPEMLETIELDLTPDETIALNGYRGAKIEADAIKSIIAKAPIKGISALSNLYKLVGLYLCSNGLLKDALDKKFDEGDILEKYFISLYEQSYAARLKKHLSENNESPIALLVKKILTNEIVPNSKLESALREVLEKGIDVQTQLLLEAFEESLLKIQINNRNSEEVIRGVLENFPNAVRKIIKGRRLGHSEYSINDEYDVQDILYVILKSIFPNLRDEDPIPKQGAKSSKIDLILREEMILVEVKMMKVSDKNETHFIEQLKVDFESYHQCQWLKKLFCYVYDPHKKTRDLSNFSDLNGTRTKGHHTFDVEIIVGS